VTAAFNRWYDKPSRKRRPRAIGAESNPVHPPWSPLDPSPLK
jgi:hypothetical protein